MANLQSKKPSRKDMLLDALLSGLQKSTRDFADELERSDVANAPATNTPIENIASIFPEDKTLDLTIVPAFLNTLGQLLNEITTLVEALDLDRTYDHRGKANFLRCSCRDRVGFALRCLEKIGFPEYRGTIPDIALLQVEEIFTVKKKKFASFKLNFISTLSSLESSEIKPTVVLFASNSQCATVLKASYIELVRLKGVLRNSSRTSEYRPSLAASLDFLVLLQSRLGELIAEINPTVIPAPSIKVPDNQEPAGESWEGPKSPSEWESVFDLSWKTIKRRIDCNAIEAKKIHSKSWKISSRSLPKSTES